MKLRILFFGNERLATGIEIGQPLVLQGLIDHGYEIKAVITRHQPMRSRRQRPLEVETFAASKNIPVLKPTTKAELLAMVQDHHAAIGVLAAFGMIVPPEVIAALPNGIINLHPSLLPVYRGPTPIEQSILDGVKETGVSIMQLDDGMDTGPILAQQAVSLSGSESKAELAARLQELGAQLLIEQLEQVREGTLKPSPQDNSKASYCTPLSKNDGIIDWNKPAIQIEREVRAYLGWPGSQTILYGQDVTITQARVVTDIPNADSKPGEPKVVGQEIHVTTGDGALAIECLKPANKQAMRAGDFARGRRPQ